MSNGRIEILLGGKLRTLRFNLYAKEELGRIYGQDPLQALRTMVAEWKEQPMRAMRKLAYAGLVGAYEAAVKDVDFTAQDVAEWVGDAEDNDISRMFNTYLDTTKLRTLLPAEEKKSVGDLGA